MKQTLKLSWVLIALLAITVISSCKKDDDDPKKEVIAGFTYSIDAENSLKVTFTSTSQNATSLSWDFDDETTSTETNPVHTFTAAGVYKVKLTATGDGGSDIVSQDVTVVNANELLTILTGGTSKTWRLLRDVSTGVYPLEVGPDDGSGTIWWAFGVGAPLVERPCMLNDDWTFKNDGTMEFRANGDYWAEKKVGETLIFHADLVDKCQLTTDMRGPNNEDLSVWGDGDHQFEIANGKLTVSGLGAYIGLVKIGTGSEVTVPQTSVTYDIVSLTEGSTDTLIIESKYQTADAVPQAAYWRVVLVHYDNPADEPDIPTGAPPAANFTFNVTDMAVSFTNTSTKCDTYAWNFGDGIGTSTETNPSYTYTTAGFYEVSLIATSPDGPLEVKAIVMVPSVELTDAALQGIWEIRVAEKTIFVGPGLGMSNWWSVPLEFLTVGGPNPGEDWTCMKDDEFTFSAGGVYHYETNGSARNDGYMGTPNGCWTDAEIAASGNGAAFGTNTHSYALSGKKLTLTNGATGAAFIGFYKGYYGGENTDSANPPNGGNPTNIYDVIGFGTIDGTDYLYLSVDLNGDAEAGNGWSVILQRKAVK